MVKADKNSIVKDVFKTILKTIIIFVIIGFFSGLGFYVINPKFSAGVCAELGWENAEISCYELLYTRSKDQSDLYNLIVKLGNVQDYNKQNEYIDKLVNNETYADFCNSMDNSVIENYNDSKLSAQKLSLLYGTNEYIYSLKALNLLKLGKFEDSYNVIFNTKTTDKNLELAVYYYAEYLYASDIADDVKSNYFTKLNTDFISYLQTKYSGLIESSEKANNILVAYSKLKIEYTKYLIALNNNYANVNDYFTAWQTAQTNYNNIIL